MVKKTPEDEVRAELAGYQPLPIESSAMKPRLYQVEAHEALNLHLQTKDTNPCVVIPTGGGKSVMMAWDIQAWKRDYPAFRCCILAHRKELVKQNSDELLGLWPAGDIGVYAAGLKRRDTDNSIIYAMIDSIHNKAGHFPAFDCLIIDEAHRIPMRGEGKYRKFIADCKTYNPNLIVVGYTATPFRMGGSSICHRDHILNEICYEANVGDLIADDYLCNLRSKVGDAPDLSEVNCNHGGDYIINSLAKAVDTPDVVQKAVRSAMGIIQAEQRTSVIVFCVDVKHCHDVSMELRKYGAEAPIVTGKTPQTERDRIAEWFKSGRYRFLLNCNVYTEGFNAKRVDCIVDLAPTLSAGRFVQKVGRGLRQHPSKSDCLYLDYGHNIETHGPIDCIEDEDVRLAECQGCGDTFSHAVRTCPHCGWEIPKQEIERAEAEVRERRMHEEEAAQRAILGSQPEELEVSAVTVHRHTKPGNPDSMRVQYRCGLSTVREWICLDHTGYARGKAFDWWKTRFGAAEASRMTVDDAIGDLYTAQRIKDVTHTITVVRRGKHQEIVAYDLDPSCRRQQQEPSR